MASVLGGVQSMFTAAWDEPFALETNLMHRLIDCDNAYCTVGGRPPR